MPERIDGGLSLAALGGVVLLVSLFLTWYEPSRDAWTVFEINDLILAALALVVLASLGFSLVGSSEVGSALGGSIPYAGIGALIIVAATLIQSPPAAAHGTPQIGAWLALAGSITMTLGGLLLRSRVSVLITLRRREWDKTSDTRPNERDHAGLGYEEEEATETQRLPDEERP